MAPLPLHNRGRDTVASVLEGHAARAPDRPFVMFERAPGEVDEVSWAEMNLRADHAAAVLHGLGVGPGDRFNVHLANCVEFYELWFAAAKLGAVFVPTNPLSAADELGYQLGHSGSVLSVTQPDLADTVEQARAQAPQCARVLAVGQHWPEPASDGLPDAPAQPTDTLGVLYTSGTTSRPKGVEVSHAAYLFCGDAVAGHLRLRPDDRQLIVLPLFHGNGQYYSTMSALVTGASVALTPAFSASRWSTQATALGATVSSLFAAPIRMILAAERSENDQAHALRVVMFAQSVTDDALAEFERRFAVPAVQLYGMTETVVPATMNPLYGQRRGLTMGRPLTGVRVRVVDGDGQDVGLGEPGEVAVAGVPGETMMTRYLHNPEATADMLRDGWLHTGDTATVDADGYLSFVDRRKDMIKRAGENVASGEVERVVDGHPAVFESAAIGVPDEMRDEAIHVYVVRHAGADLSADELLAHCRERLAKFRVPDQVIFTDRMPRTAVGKIQKHLLRQGTGQHP